MLSDKMISIIRQNSAGMVSTVNRDGSPAVSPKGTFIVLGPSEIAFGNIRSPGTLANLQRDPRIEVCFLDVLTRRAVRLAGVAEVVSTGEAADALLEEFRKEWPEYAPLMKQIVLVQIESAGLVTSPAYDIGYTEEQLRSVYRAKLAAG